MEKEREVMKSLTAFRSSRNYRVPGGIIKQRWFRKLQLDHAKILKSLKYYKGEE